MYACVNVYVRMCVYMCACVCAYVRLCLCVYARAFVNGRVSLVVSACGV